MSRPLPQVDDRGQESNATMDISIIFVNWNSEDFLRESIASIYEYTRGISFEIIVVDNASPAGNVDELKDRFPKVTIIKSPENLGFSRANNVGFRQSSGAYVLFLNPDTQLVGPAINILLGQVKSLPGAGVVGCKLLNTDLSVQTSCIQKFPTILNQVTDIEYIRLRWPRCRLWEIDVLFADHPKPASVEVISGACMILKREVFEHIGLFSEEYFMYAEDIALCYKAKQAGLTNYYIGEAVVVHHGGKSSRQRRVNQWATMMKYRAMTQFCFKARGRAYGILFRAAIGCAAVGRLLAIALMSPFAKKIIDRRNASVKWGAVLKWAAGINARSMNTTSEG